MAGQYGFQPREGQLRMTEFGIQSLRPIKGGFWKAEFSTKAIEECEDRTFGQETLVTVRLNTRTIKTFKGCYNMP
ncbi:hypothetical protein [Pseudoblastomonas halimionae]|uniref:Uncharacterized protein n=1 Tax=Alteriqipengyuania halimionae TaxID=1926630 RepID=A0A6I4U5R7_9SPHN|nr:hypothetical protein [Alteriqipengyuania halimionae]MXP09597.1 hypothetical protein [Alteriqipengyuania halimionae]